MFLRRRWAGLTFAAWFVLWTLGIALFAASFLPGAISGPLETFGFLFGVWAVWLVVKEDPWNWPVGIVNSGAYVVVFFNARLFGDAGLNALYVVLGFVGSYWWLRGGERSTKLPMTHASSLTLALGVAAGTVLTGAFWFWFHTVKGSLPFWDALTTSYSLVAQALLTRKKVENWLFWIFVDVLYIPIYVVKGLYLTAALYGIFLYLAVLGYRTWRQNLAAHPGAES